ncbi:amidase [Uruburuella testudinis]|uniref:Amidase n=1 Tax=Uruburuella testudinis TaxID=1282863 RepID=A0ABY4DV03_9NEIS|nr:amidase [Uruburuella testudinis]UOO82500.1 amidase [Uruburuella testudinis]
MQFHEYCRYDAVGLAQLIRCGEVAADEVLQAALARLDEVNPLLNLAAQDCRGRAQVWRMPSENAPLAGVPFVLKDLLADWQGVPTLSGSRMMRGHIAPCNSYLVDAYERAGLRIFAKTTVPEWGLMPYTESELHGISRNPWDVSHTPGGSSGGAAAAVAAGVVPAAHGSDGGGSIRIPAHNCGLFGLKPSRGRTDSGPLLNEGWQGMVGEHVLSRSVRDSALLLDIAAQTQKHALYACPKAEISFSDGLKQPLRRLKIAYCRQPWLGGSVDEATQAAFAHSLKLLADAGHELEEAAPAFADAETLGRAMLVLVAAEAAKIRLRVGQAFGRKITYQEAEPATWALMAYGSQIGAAEALWSRDVMLAQRRAAMVFHQRYDVLATPVCPVLTPKVGALAVPPEQLRISRLLLGRMNWSRLLKHNAWVDRQSLKALQYIGFTAPFNMSGQPAMSVPLYWHENRLPVGTQFAAAHGNEQLLLQLAAELEQIQPWADKIAPL